MTQVAKLDTLSRLVPVSRHDLTESLRSPLRNSAVVLDRCGRLVYQQRIHQDVDMESLEEAILSAQHDEPCGPCHVTHTTSSGIDAPEVSDEDERSQPGVPKSIGLNGLSGITQDEDRDEDYNNIHTLRSGLAQTVTDEKPVAHGVTQVGTVTETTDKNMENEEEIHTEPTKKPETKKDKNKRKKGRNEKKKKSKHVAERKTTTMPPTELEFEECECIDSDGCPCSHMEERVDHVAQDEEELTRIIQQLTEFLLQQRDLEATAAPRSSALWPTDKQNLRPKKNRDKPRNSKQQQRNMQQDIDEGIEMVTADEEFIEYPDTIDAFVRTEDEIMAEVDDLDRNLLGGYRVDRQRSEVLDLTFTTSDERDVQNLMTDVLTDHRAALSGEVYVTPPDNYYNQARQSLVNEGEVWGTYKEEESNSEYDNKKNEKKMKTVPKKGKKVESGYKKGKKYAQGVERKGLEQTMREAMDGRASEEEYGLPEYARHQPTKSSEEATNQPARNRFATWKEVTLSPETDTEDQRRRVVLYASVAEEPASEKGTLLHSKPFPTKHSKH